MTFKGIIEKNLRMDGRWWVRVQYDDDSCEFFTYPGPQEPSDQMIEDSVTQILIDRATN